MTTEIDWRQDPYLRGLSQHMERGLGKFMLRVAATTTKGLGRGQPRRTLPSGRIIGLDPSAEGEYPKFVTARLLQSIRGTVRRLGPIEIEGVLSAGTEYARRLEFGFFNMTDSRGRTYFQRARPFLRPSVAEHMPQLPGFLARG